MKQRTFSLMICAALGIAMVLGRAIPHHVLAEEPLQCPQPRFTKKAPDNVYSLKNPLAATPENINKGKSLYQVRAKPMPCKHCHGANGNGRGPMAGGFNPPPRDFTCAKTVKDISDGQLFWIIKNGSPGTGMLSYSGLKDEQIWQILLYVRQLARA